ncbi:hypothetical protein GGX14DRAFT_413509 [Mycena pura]|uniref:Uncharacterized protein n=1 Tax=Mycena pura TaxID=153505 RepID=A0AAD6YSW6_9AGAR|nr:hypothetical protein GGX14DRAFT_413509 [Mycena pura]
MASFENVSASTWGNPEPQPPPQDRPRTRSTTAPGVNPPTLLRVAHPLAAVSSIHNPNAFFMQPPVASHDAPFPPGPPPIPPRIPYPQDYVSNPSNLRRAKTAPAPASTHPYAYATSTLPPLPAKPPMDSALLPPPRPPRPASVPPPSLPPPPLPVSAEVELEAVRSSQEDAAELAELAAVIALSEAETRRQETLRQKMLNQEEADLARALEASLAQSSWSNSFSTALGIHNTDPGSSNLGPPLTPSETEFSEPSYMDDETYARMLAAQEEQTPTQTTFPEDGAKGTLHNNLDAAAPLHNNSNAAAPLPTADCESLPVYSPRRELPSSTNDDGGPSKSDDEYALKLAVVKEMLAREMRDKLPQDILNDPIHSKLTPAHINVWNAEPPDDSRIKSTGAELTWVDASLESPVEHPRLGSVDTTTFPHSRPLSPPDSARTLSTASFGSEESESRSTSANHYVDTDLLHGVCEVSSIGFVAPSITPELVPMTGPMPNIISLPYGRCPPLHLQAPNWRHLLKLMARLSGTRIEPTVETMAVTRTSHLHLRTVVQFVRPHHSATDWRTVLWFTIDHPVPSNMPNARKYTNGDVDVLPWSYTLSSLPAQLRDGSETLLSRYYTIPSTPNVPFPSLPISFPNMALYLHAALEESRRYMNDSSSGIRKLAKLVEMCYPTYVDSTGEDEPSRMGGLFKKVIRGGRKDKARKGKGGNEDTYELVTPFVPDDW